MPVSPAMMPDEVPAREPMNSIFRRTASLSGWVTDSHQLSTRLLKEPPPAGQHAELPACSGCVQPLTASLGNCLDESGLRSSAACSVSDSQASASGLMMHTHSTSEAMLLQLLVLLLLRPCIELSCRAVSAWPAGKSAAGLCMLNWSAGLWGCCASTTSTAGRSSSQLPCCSCPAGGLLSAALMLGLLLCRGSAEASLCQTPDSTYAVSSAEYSLFCTVLLPQRICTQCQ